tara:strand:- start:856 stop:1260 length:405 start_codon:yes stop_codon:yes gene_type:complete
MQSPQPIKPLLDLIGRVTAQLSRSRKAREIGRLQINRQTHGADVALFQKLVLLPHPQADKAAPPNRNAFLLNPLNASPPEVEQQLLKGMRMRPDLFHLIHVLMQSQTPNDNAGQLDIQLLDQQILKLTCHLSNF